MLIFLKTDLKNMIDFFCKGFKFHLFLWIIGIFYPKSHTLFVHISHIVKSFLRIGFDMFLMISSPFLNSKGRKDFSWIQFFSWKTVYSVHFRIVYSLFTWKTKIVIQEIEEFIFLKNVNKQLANTNTYLLFQFCVSW